MRIDGLLEDRLMVIVEVIVRHIDVLLGGRALVPAVVTNDVAARIERVELLNGFVLVPADGALHRLRCLGSLAQFGQLAIDVQESTLESLATLRQTLDHLIAESWDGHTTFADSLRAGAALVATGAVRVGALGLGGFAATATVTEELGGGHREGAEVLST